MKSTGIILSGGRGSRAGGADKGLLPWRGQTRIGAVLTAFRPQVDELLISCNRNIERYRDYGVPLVTDQLAGFQGPLAGLAAALQATHTELAALAPCDCPGLPSNLVERLRAPLLAGDVQVSYADDGSRHQYLLAVLRSDCLPALQDYLDSGGRSVRGWYALLHSQVVDCSDMANQLTNLNELDA
jgi:molybdopterin-guanine dinucleotide biosynthesis protein A